MSYIEEIPEKLSQFKGEHKVELEEVFKELPYANSRFIFYETDKGKIRVLFDEIGPVLYACMVAKLSQQKYKDVYEFLKLVMEAVRMVKKCDKKGFERAGRIEQYLKESKG